MSGAYDANAKAVRTYAVDPAATGAAPAGSVASTSPSSKPVLITKNDTTDLTTSGIRGIYVGGAGDVRVIGLGDTTNSGAGTAVTFLAVPAGTILPIVPKLVMASGTTATGLIGLA